MTRAQASQRIGKLKKLINHHRYLYHVLDREEISAAALDSLKKELFDLEQQFPGLITVDSPTQRQGSQPLVKFVKVRHETAMLSFTDAFSEPDLRDWLERNEKLLTGEEKKRIDFYCEPKLDGLAIELVYEKGILKTGSTRGDGRWGEDVTQNLRTIESLPLSLENPPADSRRVIVRGEVIITKKQFIRINQDQVKRSLAPFANPRNLAAGSIRQLDPQVTAARRLDVNLYDLVTDLGQKTHEQKHRLLPALGFKTNNQYSRRCSNLEGVIEFRDYWRKNREQLPYEIDGVVVTINDNQIFEKLGIVGKAPRGAVAFKFPLRQATSVVQDVVFQVGRTGALTPVAILEPVSISGVTISRATLHNQDEIKKLGLKIGDSVIIGRAGDVIPDVIRVLPELRTGREKNIIHPRVCPSCQNELVRPEKEIVWRCPNTRCPSRSRKNFYHFVSRAAFDIVGLGPKIVDRLLDENLVQDPGDLFLLKEGDLFALERFGEKSAQNLVASIQSRRKITFSRFLYALAPRHVGAETARALAEHFGPSADGLEKLKKSNLEELQKIADVGPIVAQSICEYFSNRANLAFLAKLKKAGVQIKNEKRSFSSRGQSEGLRGLTFVLTGSLESLTREQAKEKIRSLGGDVSESLSSKINYLVVGQNPGSKLARARRLGIRVLAEPEFLKMIG